VQREDGLALGAEADDEAPEAFGEGHRGGMVAAAGFERNGAGILVAMRFSYLALAQALGTKKLTRTVRHHCKSVFLTEMEWYNPRTVCPDAAVLIGGCGRSGTTLIREMLDRHPSLAIGPETAILCDFPNPERLAFDWGLPQAEIERSMSRSRDIVEFSAEFFRAYAKKRGKPVWGDKTPRNVRALGRILKWFPNARFVHMIRDGRDVACSLRKHPKETVRHGKLVPQNVNRPITECAKRWIEDTSCGLALRGHPRVIEVRYEVLTADPETELKRICDFLRLDYDASMARASDEGSPADLTDGRLMNNRDAAGQIHRKSLSRWRRDMSPSERRDFVHVAGELLVALGYAPDHGWVEEESAKIEAKPASQAALTS